jgi:hypothetical protein
MEDISTFSLYLKIRSMGFIAPVLKIDRIWLLIDHVPPSSVEN